MTASTGLKFFSTPPHACSYLEHQKAITLFADPQAPMNNMLYGQLSLYGFRRSGNYIYRPQCIDCQACIPVRIPVALFEPDRQQRRVWKRNADVTVRQVAPNFAQAHYDLYARYIHERHADGDMERSLRINADRFGIDRQLAMILANTAQDMGWIKGRRAQ